MSTLNPFGYVSMDCNRIGGWVYDQNNPALSLVASVLIDGVHYKDVPANQPSADFASFGRATSETGINKGFEIPTPDFVKDGKEHLVTAFVGSYQINPVTNPYLVCGIVKDQPVGIEPWLMDDDPTNDNPDPIQTALPITTQQPTTTPTGNQTQNAGTPTTTGTQTEQELILGYPKNTVLIFGGIVVVGLLWALSD